MQQRDVRQRKTPGREVRGRETPGRQTHGEETPGWGRRPMRRYPVERCAVERCAVERHVAQIRPESWSQLSERETEGGCRGARARDSTSQSGGEI